MKNTTKILLIVISISASFSLWAQSTAHSFTFGGQTRTYRVYRPVNFSTSTSLPLVINMHGLNSNSQQQEQYTLFNPLADTARCVVVYPDAINGQWNIVIGQSGVNDVGFISALIDTMYKNYNIDLNRVYACGMSMGGYMSFRLACELSCKIAAIASVTGLLQEGTTTCNPTRKMPVLQIHGTADSTVAYTNTFPYASVASTLTRWRTVNGCPASPTITNVPNINTTDGCTAEQHYYGLCGDSTLLIHYKIIGGAHSWPDAAVNLGVTNRDFNATSTIWNFFKRYYTKAGVDFTGAANSYCVSAPAVTLAGVPAGGAFTGSGVSGSQFTPANATLGSNNITYTINWRGCAYTKTKQVTVNGLPIVNLSGNPDTVCSIASGFTINGGTPTGGTFSGTGVTGNNFNPSAAGIGNHVITYSYTDNNNCSNTATEPIVVTTCIPTDITDQNTTSPITLYPNPVNKQLWIETNNALGNSFLVKVFDVTGKIQNVDVTYHGSKIELNTSNLPFGTFIVKLNNDQTETTLRFSKTE
jgi:polyhydroxybutyrate depolymerase